MRIRTIIQSGLIAAACAVGGNAFANNLTINLGTNPQELATPGFAQHTQGAFTDTFLFSLTTTSFANALFQPFNFGTLNISGTSELFFDNGAVGRDASDVSVFHFAAPLGSHGPDIQLNAGNYYISVVGNATGSSGGLYLYNGTSTAAPVPEPETYAMLLAGLGLLGFVARKRKAA